MKIYFEPEFSDFHKEFPLVLIDVGASGGLEPNWKSALKYLQIIGFEPDKRAYVDLIKNLNNNRYFNIALGSQKESVPFYLTRKQTTSSIYKPNKQILQKFPDCERFDIVDQIKLETNTLDAICNENSIEYADFIKIDTQGTELSIMEGGKSIISKQIFGLEIEVEFTELYKGQPLFSDVDRFMRKLGFDLFDIQRCYWKRESSNINYGKKGQLVFGNALYLKRTEYLINIINNINDVNLRKSKLLNAISICLLYGYVDYAFEILNSNKDIIDKIEYGIINKELRNKTTIGNYYPNHKGKGKLANLFYYLGDLLSVGNSYWSVNDTKLGNQ
jgi:FkbM family methyltransferase